MLVLMALVGSPGVLFAWTHSSRRFWLGFSWGSTSPSLLSQSGHVGLMCETSLECINLSQLDRRPYTLSRPPPSSISVLMFLGKCNNGLLFKRRGAMGHTPYPFLAPRSLICSTLPRCDRYQDYLLCHLIVSENIFISKIVAY